MDASIEHTFVRLTWDDKRKILYSGEKNGNDFGVASARETIQALTTTAYMAEFMLEFEDLQHELAKWINQREDKIHRVFITMREQCWLLLVVRSSTEFDDKFEDELSDLSITVSQNEHYSQVPFSVQSLPLCSEECYRAFCNPLFTYTYECKNASAQ